MDSFQKRLSQAFAEVSDKIVYFLPPPHGTDGTKVPEDAAWGGYEYPALTRNPYVNKIIQVSMHGNSGIQATTEVIWKMGDPKSPK